ncbi:MAG: hypothetical protein DRQ55_07980 [Planctomycetota bacterium]|nr:MAG: hypothetical protein DRQ55_07980 [Planctomycetota bacterium]
MARSKRSPLGLLLGLGALLACVAVVTLIFMDGPERAAGADPLLVERGGERGMQVPDPVAGGSQGTQPLLTERAVPVPLETPPRGSASAAGRRVSGTLLRRSDRSPLSDALIEGRHGQTHSDDQGRFALPDVGADELSLVMTPDRQPSVDRRPRVVDLPADAGDLDGLQFILDTGWLLEGRVTGQAGEPVPEARVLLRRGPQEHGHHYLRADAQGRFSMRDVVPESQARPSLLLEAKGEFHGPMQLLVDLPAETRRVTGVDLVLPAAGVLEGQLFDVQGALLSGGMVRLPWLVSDGWVQDAAPELEAAVGVKRRYRIEGVPPGTYVALASAGDSSPRRSGEAWEGLLVSKPGVLLEAGRVTTLDWNLSAPARVRGRVTDAAGNPFEQADVEALWQLVLPAPGRFGSWTSALRHATARSRERVTGGLETVLTIRVGQTSTLRGGGYELTYLPRGELLLRATTTAGGELAPAERELQLGGGEDLTGVDLMLGRGLSISGQVRDEQGRPLLEARVLLVPQSDVFNYREDDFRDVGADAGFSLSGLSDGNYTLLARCPGHRDALQQVPAGAVGLSITLSPAPLLAGQVLVAANASPLPSYHLRIEDEAMFMEADIDHSEGRFEVDSLGAGTYTVTIRAAGYAPEVQAGVVLRRGEATELTLLLRRR